LVIGRGLGSAGAFNLPSPPSGPGALTRPVMSGSAPLCCAGGVDMTDVILQSHAPRRKWPGRLETPTPPACQQLAPPRAACRTRAQARSEVQSAHVERRAFGVPRSLTVASPECRIFGTCVYVCLSSLVSFRFTCLVACGSSHLQLLCMIRACRHVRCVSQLLELSASQALAANAQCTVHICACVLSHILA
jgi:hypothetical protein